MSTDPTDQSVITEFISDYDMYENPYQYALELCLRETKSDKGYIAVYSQNELLVLSPTEEKIFDFSGSVLEKAMITKMAIINNKRTKIPFYKEEINSIVIPIFNKTNFLGIICMVGGAYTIAQVKKLKQLCFLIRLHLEAYQPKTENHLSGKDFFIANMSHEIRTPLNGVIGYTQLLMQTNITGNQIQYLNGINKCSISLVQIINDILDFSKLSTKKIKLNPVPCKVSEIIEFLCDTVGPKIAEKKQLLSFDVSADVPDYITIDRQKLVQVLMNLLSNSIKFTHIDGHISVSIMVKSNLLQFTVKDNGIGIARNDVNVLFRAFTQLDNNIGRVGSGLGLSISKKLVELLGGQISVRSEFGQGSEFFFTVKFGNYQETLKQVILAKPELFKGKYVLVAFQSDKDRLSCSEILMKWGMKPTLCGSVSEAKSFLSNYVYDFELCIIDFPDIYDTIKELYPLLPVIGPLTQKIDYYLSPIINQIELYNCISKALSESRYIKKNDSLNINTSIRILVAEDQQSNQEVIMGMLATLGYKNTALVEDGGAAIAQLKENKFSLLLLDLKMPRVDGYQVIEYIRKNNINITIIPVTASIADTSCEKYGIKTILYKPISLKELQTVLIFS